MTGILIRRPLDDWEIDALIAAAQNEKERLITYVLLDTGVRITEFRSITPQDLYPSRGILVIRSLKGARPRQVPLTQRSLLALGQWLSTRPKVGFSSQWWWVILGRLGKRAGILREVTPHILRHSMAVSALRRGVDIRSVQLILGHSSLQITEQYLVYVDGTQMRSFRDVGWLEENGGGDT